MFGIQQMAEIISIMRYIIIYGLRFQIFQLLKRVHDVEAFKNSDPHG